MMLKDGHVSELYSQAVTQATTSEAATISRASVNLS